MTRKKSKTNTMPAYNYQGVGLTDEEKRIGRKKFKEYQEHSHIEGYSDFQLLEELVYKEIKHEQLKEKLKELKEGNTAEGQKEEKLIPKHIIEEMDDIFGQILKIKEKLGFFKDDKDQDPYKYWKVLFKKFKFWCNENQASRKITCPFCSKIFFLFIRTDKYEAKKFPFFKDKILANPELWRVYKEGKITADEMAKILGTSSDYINWLDKKIFNKPKDEDKTEEPNVEQVEE